VAYAEQQHAGQVDKSGHPYIEHVLRVAARVEGETARIVAVLHDVLEDTDATEEALRALGAGDEVIKALLLLRHDPAVPYPAYIAALAAYPLARIVKLADNADNADPARLAQLPEETRNRLKRKYRQALAILHAQALGNGRT